MTISTLRATLFKVLLIGLLIGTGGMLRAQTVHYVKVSATGSNAGNSWANAFTSLQSALDAAQAGDQIWVAAGKYVPAKDITGNATPTDPRTKTFLLKNGVKIYGGFAGTETVLTSRNTSANVTILSGDIDNNDTGPFSNTGGNAYHVTVANNLTVNTLLDGFTITGGSANLTAEFIGEVWGNHHGGGLLAVKTGAFLTINECVFTMNYGGYGGGAVYHSNSSPKFTNTVFSHNKCGNNYGGAMYLHYSSSSTSLINCVFVSNHSGYQGGAIYNWAPGTSITNCTFTINNATHEGGAIHNRSANPVITNSIIYGNSGGGSQGISNDTSTPVVTYSTVQGGYAGTGNISTDPVFDRSYDADGADNIWRTSDDGLILRSASPAANSGSNAGVPGGVTTDIIGAARVQNSTVNMGAYENLKAASQYFVKANANGDGSSWANAFSSLQSALDVAVSGDQIWVAGGKYIPTKDIEGSMVGQNTREFTFVLKNGVKLYGGFAGHEASLSDRNIASNPTILSGDVDSNDDMDLSNTAGNAHHIVVAYNLTAPTVIDGFTITGGNADVTKAYIGEVWGHQHGAGLLAVATGTNLTVNNCVFKSNYAGYGGGAIYHSSSSPKIYNSAFVFNMCGNSYGAAMYLHYSSSSTSIVNCVFSGNISGYQGGAIYNWAPGTTIVNTTINNNHANQEGGGIHNRSANPTIVNSIIYGNSGGGSRQISNDASTPIVTYSLVEGGHAGTGNINASPKFYNPVDPEGADGAFGTGDDGYILMSASPAVDAGSNAGVPAGIIKDMAGNSRIQNSIVNMGPYETAMSKLPQTITNFSSTSTIEFGTPAFTLNAVGGASGQPVIYESSNPAVASVSGNVVTLHGIGETIISAGQYGNDLYNPAPKVTQVMTVVKGTQIIRGLNDSESVPFGWPDYVLNANGGPSGEPLVIISTNPEVATVEGEVVSIKGVGTTHIIVSQAGNDFYLPAEDFVQELNVTPVTQMITGLAGLSTKTYGDLPYALEATGGLSGNAVIYTSSNPEVARIDGNTVTIVGAGQTVITANQEGNEYYYAAEEVRQELTVLKAHQSITFDQIADVTVGDAPVEVNAVASSALTVNFSTQTDRIILDGNQITAIAPGPVSIVATQNGDDNYFEADQVEISFCVNPAKPNISGPGPDSASPTLTSSSAVGNQWFRNGVEIEGAVGKSIAVEDPGSYTVMVNVEGCVSELSEAKQIIVTGVEELPETKVKVYPNPVRDDLFVDVSRLSMRGPSVIGVYNLAGVELMKITSSDFVRIQTSALPSGTYILKIANGAGVVNKKFIKN